MGQLFFRALSRFYPEAQGAHWKENMSKTITIQRLSKHRAGRRLQTGHKPHQKGRRTKADWCINTFPLQENRTHQEQTKKNRAENEPGQGKEN